MRSSREANLVSLLSEIVRAASERMASETHLTLFSRSCKGSPLDELDLPGDFMDCSRYNLGNPSIKQLPEVNRSRFCEATDARRTAGLRQS